MARTKKTKAGAGDRPSQPDPTAPLDGGKLLEAARPVLGLLREDLGKRAEDAGVERALRARYEAEKAAKRTADSFGEWREGLLAQVAASWFLSCVFVRTLEDRGLLGQARIAGPGAADSQTMFDQLAPSLTERDYLLFVFRELAELPATKALFDREHALVWQLSPSADAAKELLRLFRMPSAEAPAFRFGQASTRFLGDLYQDLYEDVRKRYALLQTPDFIESFILDRTLEPAIERFGLDDTTVIDPTCGSGHFLLGSFDRLFERRLVAEPGIDVGKAAHKALAAVFGADINPYAVAIARVRLTLSYLEKAGIRRVKDAPALPLHLVVADSLLHNPQHSQRAFEQLDGQTEAAGWRAEAFQLEDEAGARDVLHRRYAAVVGNPPYITEKDSAKRETYRAMYPRSAAREFSLAAPFCERFFQLARDRGSVGQITANSFMKREFGKKLVEHYLPSVNLEIIVNTSGAYIPGHGTPTVLLFGTHEPPVAGEVLSVLAKRGEPSTPVDPAKGEVWLSIVAQWRELGFDNDYITVANIGRDKLAAHPWSLGGGGAVELKQLLEDRRASTLTEVVEAIGFSVITGEDNCLAAPLETLLRNGVTSDHARRLVLGEEVRDWSISTGDFAIWPNDQFGERLTASDVADVLQFLWPYRAVLRARKAFGVPVEAKGIPWWSLREVYSARMRTPLTITFAFVATHNHFVLDRGGKVFKQSAPIIKLPATATEDDHLALLAYLNSSTACFWMKQVFHKKSSASQKHHTDPARAAYEFAGTGLQQLPVPAGSRELLIQLAKKLTKCADLRSKWLSGSELRARLAEAASPTMEVVRLVNEGWAAYDAATAEAAYWQEEIDWVVYAAFGLAEPDALLDPPDFGGLGVRPFEYEAGYSAGLSARVQDASASTSRSSLEPEHWKRRRLLGNAEVALLETRECKRMWRDTEQNVDQQAFRRDLAVSWVQELVLDEFECQLRAQGDCLSHSRLASSDAVSLAEASCALARELGGDEVQLRTVCSESSVPYLAAERMTEAGLTTLRMWRDVWSAQRDEDADNSSAPATAPAPAFAQTDFRDSRFWQLRGKLDVPKERFISYPGCESDEDGEPVYGWAGWNHLQRAQALASLYQRRKTDEGWTADRLTPMLAGLLELLPWIKQWHNEPDAEFGGLKMGDYYSDFLDGECRSLGLTHADLEAWRPTKRIARKSAATPASDADGTAATVKPKKPRRKKSGAAEAPTDDGLDGGG